MGYTLQTVYPRMYGETRDQRMRSICYTGLSPHVRGNRWLTVLEYSCRGSIPACTGKPRGRRGRLPPGRVYPRMYGETFVVWRDRDTWYGLSPHVRGNRPPRRDGQPDRRSIPACTGKPGAASGSIPHSWVYPRMYGETMAWYPVRAGDDGLSPHVRGNPLISAAAKHSTRSIPACTGKPGVVRVPLCAQEVYPRMYGETEIKWRHEWQERGLSPHVRGNRHMGVGPAAD